MARHEDKGFQEKLKRFFRINKTQGITRSKSDEYVTVTDELEAELKHTSPLGTRVKAIKELLDWARSRRLETYTIEKLWILLKDLLMIRGDVPTEVRHLVFSLFTAICRNQIEKNGAVRSNFFTFIQSHDILEDAGPRFEFLRALTENGRDVSYFDEKIGPFVLACMMPSSSFKIHVSTREFMSFLVNVIKFTQSFLDSDVLEGIIEKVCHICCESSVPDDMSECLNVLSAVICYPSLPPGSLSTLLATLCRTVNAETLCSTSWKIMRDLLGTHFGHSGLLTMCRFMENGDPSQEIFVIRGAVFFVGAVLWGNKMVRSLKYSPSTVLSSFRQALDRKHPYISFEVMMRVQDLIRNQGEMVQSVSWDLILDIMEKVVDISKPGAAGTADEFQYLKLSKAVNECLDTIQRTVDSGGFCGSLERFYAVVDATIKFRPEHSVEKLLQYKVTNLLQRTHPGWFGYLVNFTERHFKGENRGALKVLALNYITSIGLANRHTNEEDLIDKIILPYLKTIETEAELSVRQQGVKFIVAFMMDSESKKGHDLLHILEKIVNRPYELASGDTVHIFSEKEVGDVHDAIEGLIQIFQIRMYSLPSSIPITAYKIVVKHLATHYKRPATLEDCPSIRRLIFECFFKIRANSIFHLGFPNPVAGNVIKYSSYLAVDHREGDESTVTSMTGMESPVFSQGSSNSGTLNSGGGSPQPQSTNVPQPVVTSVSLTIACKLVVSSLRKEKDWEVLELILKQIPHVMENKALILSKHGNDIDYLANALCGMMLDKSSDYPDSLRRRPIKFQRTDFQGYLYPILTALVSYHNHLDNSQQLKIVKCLERGLVSRSAQMCIVALSTCILEMKDTMHKLLPEVLLSLSKITPKVNIAIPVLEFLSTLIHLPRVFASFVQDQYMSIFAIALPYTNPFKFNQYTVSLAHHVIAMWFLKCRLSFRKGFVSYIMKGLLNNVLNPCEEEKRRSAMDLQNEDSSSRKRSSSLNEQSSKRRERPISGTVLGPALRGSNETKSASKLAFHQELTETCVDLMARYAFSDSSALPTRFPSTTFLLNGGNSQTWLVDNQIITITTSGCTQKELRDSMCDRCFLLCRKPNAGSTNPSAVDSTDDDHTKSPTLDQLTSSGSDSGNRRRHRSEFVTGSSKTDEHGGGGLEGPGIKTKDDSHLGLEHKLQIPTRRLSLTGEMLEEGQFGDWAPKPKSDHVLCTCWCQGWAEIHIRCPTGNTSWMMRIQNQLGNNSGIDFPFRELSAIFLKDPVDVQNSSRPQDTATQPQPHSSSSSGPSSARTLSGRSASSPHTSPTRHTSVEDGSSGGPMSTSTQGEESTGSAHLPLQKSNSSPSSPKSPSACSPIEERRMRIPLDNSKQPVHRSNSSPEMESWKYSYVNQQTQIQEQDEEDSAKNDDDVFGAAEKHVAASEVSSTFKGGMNSHMTKGGTTSPYRGSYEAIPEEVIQKDGASLLSSSPAEFIQTVQNKVQLQTQHSVEEVRQIKVRELDLTPLKRERVNTVSVMSGAHVRTKGLRRILSAGSGDSGIKMNRRDYEFGGSGGSQDSSNIRSGMSPGFVFLQLFGREVKPLLVPAKMENSIKVIDYIPPYETHKIGVLYVGQNQSTNETLILQNPYGSVRYRDFLQGLGRLVKLREVDPQKTFLGGLSRDGDDGEFAYIWQDDVMQVMFHVATLMPNKTNDPNCNSKKRHIGNDYVAIVYNNTNEEYDITTIKGQFLYACVIIQPLDHGTNRIIVKAKPVLEDQIGHNEAKIVSDRNLPIMARQLALHSNLASLIFQSAQQSPYASNWLERLRKIKQLRSRLEAEAIGSGSGAESSEFPSPPPKQKVQFNVVDFTEFV